MQEQQDEGRSWTLRGPMLFEGTLVRKLTERENFATTLARPDVSNIIDCRERDHPPPTSTRHQVLSQEMKSSYRIQGQIPIDSGSFPRVPLHPTARKIDPHIASASHKHRSVGRRLKKSYASLVSNAIQLRLWPCENLINIPASRLRMIFPNKQQLCRNTINGSNILLLSQ